MNVCAALLRGINVGGHRVKMDRLRALFTEMGFEEVGSVIASGNVVFRTPLGNGAELRRVIEGGLEASLGYAVETFVRTTEEVEEVLATPSPAREPLEAGSGRAPGIAPRASAEETRAEYVAFLHDAPDPGMQARLRALESPADRFSFGSREIFWSIADKLSASPLFGTGIERAIGAPTTMRNRRTLAKILTKLRVTGADG